MLHKVILKQTLHRFKACYVECDADNETEARRLALESDNGEGFTERVAFRPTRRVHSVNPVTAKDLE